MRLLHLIHTPRHSGAEVLVRDLCLRHTADGHTCGVAAFEPSAIAFEPELEKLRAVDVALEVPSEPLSGLARIRGYAAAIQRFKPDVIFAHSALPSIYGRLAALAVGSRTRFVTVLHSGSGDYADPKLRWAERLLRWRTDGMIAVSQSAADTYLRELKTSPPLQIILNGVDLDRFQAARDRRDHIRVALGLTGDQKLLLQVGRIAPVKQQRVTLSALLPMLKADPALKLWFAGIVEDEAYAAAFLAELADAGLGERLRFLGPRLDVPDLLSAADVYVMPSRSEAHSIAFLEAMASGPPIVATAIESFKFAGGFEGVSLIELDDDNGFETSVRAALARRGRISHNMEPFDLTATARLYIDVSRKVLGN